MSSLDFESWWGAPDGYPLFPSIAYRILLGSIDKPLVEDDLDDFIAELRFAYSVEGQAVEPSDLRGLGEMPDWKPVAPVSLAGDWAPFSYAGELLGPPLGGYVHASMRRCVVVWDPPELVVDIGSLLNRCPHDAHLDFLLTNACGKAVAQGKQIGLVFCKGFSFREYMNGDENAIGMDAAMAMHEAGYMYTERVAR